MKTSRYRIGMAVVVGLGVAAIVAAQGPGRPGPGREEEFGVRSVTGEPFQANFTSTKMQNVITTTVTGTLARDDSGDTYQDIKAPANGQNPGFERIMIRNLTTMENYIINVTKQTFQQFALRSNGGHGGPPNGGKGPWAGGPNANRPTPTELPSYTLSDMSFTCAPAEELKTSQTVQPPGANTSITVTDDRISCPAFHQILMETHTDPRFGTTTFQLSAFTTNLSVSFTPPAGYAQEPARKFGWHGNPPPPPVPQP